MTSIPFHQAQRLLEVTSRAPIRINGTTVDGEEVDFRYRHGRARILVDGAEVWAVGLGEENDDYLSAENAMRLVHAVLQLRSVRADIEKEQTEAKVAALQRGLTRLRPKKR